MTITLRQRVPKDVRPASLEMPDQNLKALFHDQDAPGISSDWSTLSARAILMAASLVCALALGWLSLGWFAADRRLTLVGAGLAGLSSIAFFWVALSVGTATLGLFWRPRPVAIPLHGLKVAILLPMYGEPPKETIGHAVTLLGALAGKERHSFALHILSDTRSPAAALLEEATVALARKIHPDLTIHYRRRARNVDYKSGNIRDWVQSSGAAHDVMLVLDADSIMGPETVVQMADAMAQEPGLGLIQTVPRILPGQTIWQGLQSFASEVYGVNLGRGFALWAGASGNFLGHNALVRIRAFATSAGLPHLPGRAPRGGVILSHDFVEAALLRRAGWGVRMMPEAADSFEDTPETLIAYLKRDQRWCQGNLQHLRLLFAPGLHPLSRFHLLQGAMAYLSSVCWLVLLILWTLPSLVPDFGGTAPNGPAIPFGLPPISQPTMAGLVVLSLIAPKLLGVISHLRNHSLSFAKAPRFAGLVLAELILSALLAPALMIHQVRAVLRTLWGLDGGWMPHVAGRSDLRTLCRFHAIETIAGVLLVLLALNDLVSLWLLPIGISLCLTVLLAAFVQMPRAALTFGAKDRNDA